MPREIADSDAESDLDVPRRPSASPIPENVDHFPPPSTIEQKPNATLEFDQFLSPTQRLSSAVERQDPSSSTDKFLLEIAQADQGLLDSVANTHGYDGSFEHGLDVVPRHSAKRTLSDIEDGRPRYTQRGGESQQSLKRAKTYASSRSQRSEASSLFTDIVSLSYHPEKELSQTRPLQQSGNSSDEPARHSLAAPSDIITDGLLNTARGQTYQQRGATTFLQGNIQNKSISKSSLSGYGGFSLDFRGAGVGLDMGANPFGSLSQVSLDGGVDPSQVEKFASLFHHSQQSSNDVPDGEHVDSETGLQPTHLKEMATSSAEKIQPQADSHSAAIVGGVHQDDPTKSVPQKRGRKPKAAQTTADATVSDTHTFQRLHSEDPLDLPQEQYKPRPSRSRAGTVDSINSHASHESHTTNTSKRKRKREAAEGRAENGNSKGLSSELNLSDPAMIGAPKELYVPRPSKSRSRRVIDDNDEDELQTPERAPDEASASATPAKMKKKPGRKSKVKRAKTSAAALLKSAEMYDEDDKDCIMVDEMPAKVKMGPLPEVSMVKRESTEQVEPNEPQEDDQNHSATSKIDHSKELQKEVKISIDIPKLPIPDELEPVIANPEPKKRGRKPKNKPEPQIQVDTVTTTDKDEAEEQNTETELQPDQTRTILGEKDPNTTPAPRSKTPTNDGPPSLSASPKKPVHSPLKPKTASKGPLWSRPRIGLSRRTTIPSLLRKLDRTREPPKVLERKEKLSKRQQEEDDKRRLEAEEAGEDYDRNRWEVRGKDGMLLEWDE